MKKIFGYVVFILVFIVSASVPAFSADVAKIGLVDFQKIMINSSAGKLIQKKLQAKGDGFAKKLENMQQGIVQLEKKLKNDSMVLSSEKRDEKKREYRIKVNDFNQAKKELQYELQNLEKKEIKQMQKAVFEIVKKIGKNEGYLLIFERKTAGVMYNPDSIDITDKIISIYNKLSAK